MTRKYTWLKLNDTHVALNENGQLVGYMAELKQPPSKRIRKRVSKALQGA